HARCRVLCRLLKRANPDLHNSFESRTTAAAALGMKLKTYDAHIAALKAAGYVRTQEFRYADGTQAKGNGIQFCLPGRVFGSSQPWVGPTVWSNRRDGALRKPSQHHPEPVLEIRGPAPSKTEDR